MKPDRGPGRRKRRQPKRKRTCGGKRRFRDEQEAIACLHRIGNYGAKLDGGKVPQRPYECGRCKGWHLTSQQAPR